MGDREFEDFLNNDDDDNGDEIMPECQKRLLFDIIQTKMDNSTNLIETITNLHTRDPRIEYKDWLDELKGISKQAFSQLDYLMTVVLEELDNPED